MAEGRLRVALVYGGRSAEHEVSLRSCRSIFDAMDTQRYETIPVLITLEGAWYQMPAEASSFDPNPHINESDRLLLSPDPAHKGFLRINANSQIAPLPVDVVFPVLHGTYGEDGTLQGLLEMANVPYVGCGVLASSVGMDKVLMKSAFRDGGLMVGPYFWFLRSRWRQAQSEIVQRAKEAEFPLFIKPANLGSSVGISCVKTIDDFSAAVEKATCFDRKILVEDGIEGRELEVSVLGNEDPIASLPGEVVSHSGFYDYEEKYIHDTAELIMPAELPEDISNQAQAVAVAAFKAVDGSDLARVDMFLTPDNLVVVNEINTLPGFTSISMYPKLWEITNIPYSELIDRLIDLAIDRHKDKQETITCRQTS